MRNKIKTINTVDSIRTRDVIPVLENAKNYGPASVPLYQAAIDEILELRAKVIKLGGELPYAYNFDGHYVPLRTGL